MMKKYKLTLIIHPPFGKSTVVCQRNYPFEFMAVIGAWIHGRHYQSLIQSGLFDLQTTIEIAN